MYSETDAPPVPQGFDAFNDWFTGPFRAFFANWGVWVLQGLVFIGILLGVFLVLFLPLFAIIRVADKESASAAIIIISTMLAIFIAVLLVSAYLVAGMARTALKQLRGEPITVGDIFSASDTMWKLIGVYFFTSIFTLLASLLCFFPGIILAFLLMLAVPIAVDRNISAFESVKLSWNTCKQNWGFFTIYFLVIGLVLSAANSITFGLASIAVTPLNILITCYVYVSIFDRGGALNSLPGQQAYLPPAYTPPPSAEGPVVPPSIPPQPTENDGNEPPQAL